MDGVLAHEEDAEVRLLADPEVEGIVEGGRLEHRELEGLDLLAVLAGTPGQKALVVGLLVVAGVHVLLAQAAKRGLDGRRLGDLHDRLGLLGLLLDAQLVQVDDLLGLLLHGGQTLGLLLSVRVLVVQDLADLLGGLLLGRARLGGSVERLDVHGNEGDFLGCHISGEVGDERKKINFFPQHLFPLYTIFLGEFPPHGADSSRFCPRFAPIKTRQSRAVVPVLPLNRFSKRSDDRS